ncbi:MAG: glycosyltransferase [Lachnospiraceae bacterium]|jgi:glycosyltransferase involved in cell wall biosynthesis|nr:glycosyltransferase [Lachnospiraceae bacterium]
MNKKVPKVSVILPSLNVAEYIEACMESVVHQTLQDLEMICVDAGSTDGTREILERYAREDSRIVVLHSDTKSYGRQVNMGLDRATGEYVAILETDDWIEPDMYQYLYDNGAAESLDYVASDFDLLYRLQNGADYLIRQRLFHGDKQDWYGRILDSDEIATLRSADYVLWKGLYRREFLNSHHIRLHPSPGAAFQDMGFLQQVKTYAKQAKYLDKSFYRYRQDREEASSKGLDGLRYYENEFRWINGELRLCHLLNPIHRKYYYFAMSISFITKYDQILVKLNGDWQDKRLADSCEWFSRQISEAVRIGLLDKAMYGNELWERLMLLLASQEAYSQLVMEQEKGKQDGLQKLLGRIKNRPVMIFGCGIRGERLMFYCDSNHIKIHSFCDNNLALFGKEKCGFPILSPSDLKNEADSKDGVILLSMKIGQEEVYRQLIATGIEDDRIIQCHTKAEI